MAPLDNAQYTIGWICTTPQAMAITHMLLDESHGRPVKQHARDSNSYELGSIGKHNVVVACLNDHGKVNAAAVALQMLSSFPSIQFGIMVGIGGGIPCSGHDVRLGDVVISTPMGDFGGVVQHDIGKSTESGFQRTGYLDKPPSVILSALPQLASTYKMGRSRIPEFLQHVFQRDETSQFKECYGYQGTENDMLFEAGYSHSNGQKSGSDGCAACDPNRRVERQPRITSNPVVHFGTIASGDRIVESAKERDELGRDYGALCVETGAAGVMDNFPCVVICGISNYADTHKNKRWQRYAAATAAACAKELLDQIAPHQVETTYRARYQYADWYTTLLQVAAIVLVYGICLLLKMLKGEFDETWIKNGQET